MLARKSKKVLILGEETIARPIAREFEQMGCEVVFQSHPGCLPRLTHHDSITQMREVLSWFYRESEGAGLIHPGVSPWADRAELQTLGHELGLTVIGPSARVVSLFANKLNLMIQAESLGIATLLLSADPIHTVREIHDFFSKSQTRLPFWVRSARGSGHFSRFLVQDAESLTSAGKADSRAELEIWIEQLRWNLGEVILFPERSLELARHVLVPFVRYEDGQLDLFPFVDMSLQCRNRKIMEFCSEAGWAEPDAGALKKWTIRLAQQVGIVGLGCFEFALNPVHPEQPYFVDAQARLNTGYLLWQNVAGVSAVELQLAAQGLVVGVQRSKEYSRWAQGVSMRVYAEDSLQWIPQAGEITECEDAGDLPAQGHSEILLAYGPLSPGASSVPCSEEDSGLLALIQVFAQDLESLMEAAPAALNRLWISGSLQTNQRFLSELIGHPWVQRQMFHLNFIQEDFIPALEPSASIAQLACWACLPLLLHSQVDSKGAPTWWKVGDRWLKQVTPLGVCWEVEPTVSALGDGQGRWMRGRALLEGRRIRMSVTQMDNRWLVRVGLWFLWVRPYWQECKKQQTVELKLFSQLSGRVHALWCRSLSTAARGVPIVLIESNGVLVSHAYPVEVVVREWKVVPDQRVGVGQVLAILELTS